jgi:long-chain fatty acid transport protein
MKNLHTTLASLIVLFALAPSGASAQPMDTYGMTSRSVAMGGAVSADVEDVSSNYYNPAGLVRGDHMRIGIGWFGAFHQLDVDGLNSGVDAVHGLNFGLGIPATLDRNFRFAFGLGVHLNDDRLSRTRSLPQSRPRWEFYDNRPHRTYLAAHLAIELFEVIRIGGGISFLSYAANRLAVRGDLDIAMPDMGSRLEHEIRADLTTIRYPQIGVQVQPIPELSFGLVYRGGFALSNILNADVDATILSGGIAAPFDGYFGLFSESVNAFVPQQVSLAGSWSPTPQFTLNLEVTWVNWSSYISPVGTSDIVLDLAIPPELADTIFVPTIRGSRPIAANFEDRFVPRIGVEGMAYQDPSMEFRVRGGFFYEASPVPQQTGITNLVDTDRLAFSAGAGLRLNNLRPLIDGFISFDLHLQYALLPYRAMQKTSLVDPTGDYVAGGHIFAGGLSMEVGFR